MGKLRSPFLLILLLICAGWIKAPKLITLQPQKSGITTLRFVDTSRKDRPLITEVWYPVEENVTSKPVAGLWVRCPEARDAPLKKMSGKYPLILMSHGMGGDRLNLAWLAEIMAANGYIVAAMDHYGNTWNTKHADGFLQIWERPKDVSFVLDQLLVNSPFSSHLDREKIGFIGYSLGGLTGLWVAGGTSSNFDKTPFQEIPDGQMPSFITQELIDATDFSPACLSYKDERVAAFFLMAPALVHLFDLASLEAIQKPMHVYTAEGDHIVHAERTLKIVAAKIKKAVCTLIPGSASHYVFINEATKGGRAMLDRNFVQDDPSVNRKKIHQDVGLTAVKFFDESLR